MERLSAEHESSAVSFIFRHESCVCDALRRFTLARFQGALWESLAMFASPSQLNGVVGVDVRADCMRCWHERRGIGLGGKSL